jgi:hypothetical protein
MNAGSDDVILQEEIPGGGSGATVPEQGHLAGPDFAGKQDRVNRPAENRVADEDDFGLLLAQMSNRPGIEVAADWNQVRDQRRQQEDGENEYR